MMLNKWLMMLEFRQMMLDKRHVMLDKLYNCNYFSIFCSIPLANKPNAKPMINPIRTFFKNSPMIRAINTIPNTPIPLRLFIILIVTGCLYLETWNLKLETCILYPVSWNLHPNAQSGLPLTGRHRAHLREVAWIKQDSHK